MERASFCGVTNLRELLRYSKQTRPEQLRSDEAENKITFLSQILANEDPDRGFREGSAESLKERLSTVT